MKKLLVLLLFVLPFFGNGQNKYTFRIDTIYEVIFSDNYTPFQALSVFANDYELTELNRSLNVKTCKCVILENVWVNTTDVPIVWTIDLRRNKFEYGTRYQVPIIYSERDKEVIHIRYEETHDELVFTTNLYLYSNLMFVYGRRLDPNGYLVNYFYTSIITYL